MKARLGELERAGLLALGEGLPKGIDPLYLFAELPTLFKSLKRGIPSVLVYQGEVYRVQNPGRVVKALGMSEQQGR